ncbi:MAG: hypothetical protein ACLRS8_16245 [Parabacteroides merdae]
MFARTRKSNASRKQNSKIPFGCPSTMAFQTIPHVERPRGGTGFVQLVLKITVQRRHRQAGASVRLPSFPQNMPTGTAGNLYYG